MTGRWRIDRGRLRLGVVMGLIVGAIAFLGVQALSEATVYYKNADEALAERDELGDRRFRVQGLVVDGSVEETGDRVAFTIVHEGAEIDVRHQGDPHELFRPGLAVVLEGQFAEGTDRFESDHMMVRHSEEYREENPDRVPSDAP